MSTKGCILDELHVDSFGGKMSILLAMIQKVRVSWAQVPEERLRMPQADRLDWVQVANAVRKRTL